MRLLDRYILVRFSVNFLILFSLLFIFAATVDLILHLDRFIDAARRLAGEDGGAAAVVRAFFGVVGDFQFPRLFQFYAFLHGLTAVGATAFTLAQMVRYRELTALMASGVSLYRVAMPFFIAMFAVSLLQIANQELMMPRVAPLLLRGHGQVGQTAVREFEVRLTPDAAGRLLQAPSFDPVIQRLRAPTILDRDERGLTLRRITAESATWDAAAGGWRLEQGRMVRLRDEIHGDGPEAAGARPLVRGLVSEPIDFFATDLDPRLLTVQRHNEFAGMLSMAQIDEILQHRGYAGTSEERALLRYRYARFATVLLNLLVLALALPCFLLREPANLLKQSVICAGVTVPAMLGAAIGMTADLPGIPPAAGVFLPVIVLTFIALAPWTYFKT